MPISIVYEKIINSLAEILNIVNESGEKAKVDLSKGVRSEGKVKSPRDNKIEKSSVRLAVRG